MVSFPRFASETAIFRRPFVTSPNLSVRRSFLITERLNRYYTHSFGGASFVSRNPVALRKVVLLGIHVSAIVPVGPFRCFAMFSSAVFFFSVSG